MIKSKIRALAIICMFEEWREEFEINFYSPQRPPLTDYSVSVNVCKIGILQNVSCVIGKYHKMLAVLSVNITKC